MKITYICAAGAHGEQGLKSVLILTEGKGVLLELRCNCVYKLAYDRGGVLRQHRLAFRQTPTK